MRRYGLCLAVLLALGLLPAASASAISFSFAGNYTLEDDDNDGFSELLSFDNPLGSGSGAVGTFDPVTDAIFSDGGLEWVVIDDLTLDPTDATSPFDFDPTFYAGGFELHDDDGSLLLSADLSVEALVVTGGTGTVNSALVVNLTGITAGGGYALGSSEIVDAFVTGASGIANLTLQFPGADLAAQILAGNTVDATYSGSAAPVPEPGPLLLVSLGVVGLAIAGRRRAQGTRD